MSELNTMQQQAVEHVDGPLLILAGAGSGKTRVITERAAYLIKECGVAPWNILAITFTNKAAGEMKERIGRKVGMGSEQIWISTFHSMCVRILRRYGELIGYRSGFSIYDTDDQKAVMKRLIKAKNLDTKTVKERTVLNAISSAKNEMIGPEQYRLEAHAAGNFSSKITADLYGEYQRELMRSNALDFDDLICQTVNLLNEHADVRDYYQERFKYIMVDEYQDTNTAQFQLIKLLAGKYKNLCVVGDDDQSIYKFRGANIHNILDFEDQYSNAKVIRLEENYRSTQTILDAANGVIAHNKSRKGKTLYTSNEAGERVYFTQFDTAYEEAGFVTNQILKGRNAGKNLSDFAILYRTNAQSRMLEESLIASNIPYRIVGGVNFYSRREIKDILAYLKAIDNPQDDLSIRRIINVPKRGIGQTTIDRVQAYATANEISFYEAALHADRIPEVKPAALKKLTPFTDMIEQYKESAVTLSVSELIKEIDEDTGYTDELRAERSDEAQARIENIEELFAKARNYEDMTEEPTLEDFLQEVSLVADIDTLDEDSDYVVLMTLHGAKGLEFDTVFLVGMEDGLFPGYMSIVAGDQSEIEEERRLCYVGITRAQKQLFMTAARARMIHGQTQYNAVSRFVEEVPQELIKGYVPKSKKYEEDDFSGSVGAGRSQGQRNMNTGEGSYSGGGRSYAKSGRTIFAKPGHTNYSMKTPEKKGLSELGYGVGDRVKHFKFGEGEVLDIKDGGRDFEVTVEFDNAGTKKMFAGFAKLKKA